MLSEFIAETRSDPFAWGHNDCALWTASAVRRCTGQDPARDLRGTYGTRFECRRLIMAAGSLLALVAPRMDRLGLNGLDGDGVAVVRMKRQMLCAVILQGRAVMRTETGLLIRDDFDVLRGWSW